ncbi:hypothetical protein GE09DRAFT_1080230 [Coniochaeta sp. 2T2.1]|nr:hypothetical protein GE09DRAFT_1080230 [Coniochaeta sp. 2T2.1]
MTAPPYPPKTKDLDKFKNFDENDVFLRAQKAAKDPNALNFVVLFGPHRAKIAFDLGTDDIKNLWRLNDPEYPVRWINFWNTSQQQHSIKIIGKRYGFSRRLGASITYWDDLRMDIKRDAEKQKREAEEQKREAEKQKREQQKPDDKLVRVPNEKSDLESGDSTRHVEVQAQPVRPPPTPVDQPGYDPETLENFKVLQDSLNYTTTDHGKHFFCFGANWLHRKPEDKTGHDAKLSELVPPHHWAWYALCADDQKTNTVVSIHEAPNYSRPPKGVDPADYQSDELENIRKNTVAVLEQLSFIGSSKYTHNLFQLKSIREPHKIDTSERSSTMVPPENATETAASNLFYYLFEDYSAVAPVLNNSGQMLKNLSDRVLGNVKKGESRDTSTVIQELHELGKGLRQLDHLFKSYKNLFETIRKSPPLEPTESREVKLERQARDRFKRLIDRLQLLMLNTINEYLDEKKELSNTYFNLTAQKDSEATARLTRSATLLAKLSVFFLPISFVTSYFSVQIEELNHYTAKTYWYTFAVVATLSFVSLFFFGKMLMFFSDWLDDMADVVIRRFGKMFGRRREKED